MTLQGNPHSDDVAGVTFIIMKANVIDSEKVASRAGDGSICAKNRKKR